MIKLREVVELIVYPKKIRVLAARDVDTSEILAVLLYFEDTKGRPSMIILETKDAIGLANELAKLLSVKKKRKNQ